MMFRAGRESDQASFTRLPQSLISRKPYHICCWGKRWGSVPARIERVLVLLDELDGDPDAEPSLCRLVVGPGNDQVREGEDDNGGDAWVRGGTYPLPPERIPTRRRGL